MSLGMLALIIVIVLLLGGSGLHLAGSLNQQNGIGLVGLILIILLILWLTGAIRG